MFPQHLTGEEKEEIASLSPSTLLLTNSKLWNGLRESLEVFHRSSFLMSHREKRESVSI
jgi:hypothetical protein